MKTRGYLLTLITSSAFGLGTVLGQMASSALNPFLVASLNFLIGGLLLLAFLAWRGIPLWQSLTGRDWRNIVLLSIFGTALPACCIIYGLSLTSAIKAGFLIQLQGVMATLFAVIFLREHLTWKQIMGMLLLLIGGLFVIMKDLHNSFWSAFTLGDGLVILGCIGFGYALVPGKQLASKIDALPLTTWKLLISALVTFPLLLTQPHIIPGSIPIFFFWLMPIYIVSNFCIGYITQQAGLKYLQAWESATIMQSTPIFATLSAIFILGDTLSPLQLVGGCIMLGGGCIVALGDIRTSKGTTREPARLASSTCEN